MKPSKTLLENLFSQMKVTDTGGNICHCLICPSTSFPWEVSRWWGRVIDSQGAWRVFLESPLSNRAREIHPPKQHYCSQTTLTTEIKTRCNSVAQIQYKVYSSKLWWIIGSCLYQISVISIVHIYRIRHHWMTPVIVMHNKHSMKQNTQLISVSEGGKNVGVFWVANL